MGTQGSIKLSVVYTIDYDDNSYAICMFQGKSLSGIFLTF